MILSVGHNHGSQGTRPETVDRFQRKITVRRRLTGLDAEFALEFFDNPLGAAHMASGAQAGANQVFAPRHQAERSIEGGDP